MSGTKSKTASDSAASDSGGSRSTEEHDHHSPASSTATLSFAIPIKQDPSDQYWSVLGYNMGSYSTNISKPDNIPSTFQASPNPGPPVMLPAIADLPSGEGGVYSGAYVPTPQQQQQQYATPIALSSGISFEIGQSMRGLEAHSKPSLFQTPIFGME